MLLLVLKNNLVVKVIIWGVLCIICFFDFFLSGPKLLYQFLVVAIICGSVTTYSAIEKLLDKGASFIVPCYWPTASTHLISEQPWHCCGPYMNISSFEAATCPAFWSAWSLLFRIGLDLVILGIFFPMVHVCFHFFLKVLICSKLYIVFFSKFNSSLFVNLGFGVISDLRAVIWSNFVLTFKISDFDFNLFSI